MKDCQFNTAGMCSFKYKTLKGDELVISSSHPRFILNDGTLVSVRVQRDEGSGGTRNKQYYAYIFVDINGAKGPNRMGRDVFVFIYFIYFENYPQYDGIFSGCPSTSNTRNHLLNNSSYGCNRQAVGGGGYANSACASLIMKDGWQIKSDYPW